MRIAVGLVVILGILLALAILDDVGQSELEPGARIVSSTSRIERSFGGTVYSVFFNETGDLGFTSKGRVTRAAAAGDPFVLDCYEQAVVGEPLPAGCPTPAPSVSSNRGISGSTIVMLILSLGTIAGLTAMTWRYVASVAITAAASEWQPPTLERADPPTPVSLMQSANTARDTFSRESSARRLLARPGRGRYQLVRGGLVGLVVTLWFCLTAGFAAGGGLALFSAGLIYLGVIIVYALSLAEMMATGTPEEPFYQRLAFMGGAATGLVIGGAITMNYLATSFEGVGLRWLS